MKEGGHCGEKLREVKPKVEEPIGYELTIQDTNEVNGNIILQ